MRGKILNTFGCIGLLVLSACGEGGGGSAPTPLATVPGAPTSVSATAGQGQATVSFTAPTSTGGAAITSYTVQASGTSLSGNIVEYYIPTNTSYAGTVSGSFVTKSAITGSASFPTLGSSDGSVLGSSTNCSFSGTVTPRPSGKNVYNVSMTFTGTQCAPGSGVTSGVAVLNTVGASKYVYTAGLNALKNNGFFWIGRKAL